jgi:hypothetical protein
MSRKIQGFFIFSAAVILFVTAAAKIYGATGTAEALGNSDPLIPLSNRQVFYLVGGIELFISAFLLVKDESQGLKLSVIAWLATNYLVYRAGLWWMGMPNFCDCLGNLNEKLFISPRILNHSMLALLVWLVVGSYLLLILDWLGHRELSKTGAPSGAKSNGVQA